MGREDELQQLCLTQIREYVEESRYQGLKVEMEVPIIKDCTFVYEEGFSMYLGHARTDVCVYVKADHLSAHLKETAFFKLYQNGDKNIRIPIIVLETKRGDKDGKLNTDSIRSRTIIAREMNEIFPFCGYFFIADHMAAASPGKVHRAGKHYNAFFTRDETADAKWIEDGMVPIVEHCD